MLEPSQAAKIGGHLPEAFSTTGTLNLTYEGWHKVCISIQNVAQLCHRDATMQHKEQFNPAEDGDVLSRRGFVGIASTAAMACGLAGGYGAFGAMAGRFLYPAKATEMAWLFVARVADLGANAAINFKTPAGAPITIARQGEGNDAESFVALSSTCPHLGCQVFWEAHNNRFFCPCHNGVFDPSGLGTEGPPKGQQLLKYHLRVENGLLFIEVPSGGVTS